MFALPVCWHFKLHEDQNDKIPAIYFNMTWLGRKPFNFCLENYYDLISGCKKKNSVGNLNIFREFVCHFSYFFWFLSCTMKQEFLSCALLFSINLSFLMKYFHVIILLLPYFNFTLRDLFGFLGNFQNWIRKVYIECHT